MNILKLSTSLIVFFSTASLAAEPLVYFVKKGDTLSTIAQKKVGSPIFKNNGSLKKLLRWNSKVANPDLIFPGQKLAIGNSKNPKLPKKTKRVIAAALAEPKVLPAKHNVRRPQSAAEQNSNLESVQSSSLTGKEVPHYLSLASTMGITTLAGFDNLTNTSAVLFSSHDVGVRASWKQDWTDSFFTDFSIGLRSVDFQPPSSNSKFISESKKLNSSLSIAAGNLLSRRVSLNYSLSYGNELYLRGISSTTVAVDAIPIPKVALGTSIKLFDSGRTSVGIKLNLNYLHSATSEGYTIGAGSAYQGGLYLRRLYGIKNSVELDFGYKERTQNMSLLNYSEKSVFGTLVFSFPLFQKSEDK